MIITVYGEYQNLKFLPENIMYSIWFTNYYGSFYVSEYLSVNVVIKTEGNVQSHLYDKICISST